MIDYMVSHTNKDLICLSIHVPDTQINHLGKLAHTSTKVMVVFSFVDFEQLVLPEEALFLAMRYLVMCTLVL